LKDTKVLFQPKTKQDRLILSTNIYTLLYHFSKGKWTLPLWREKFCWELFLEGDSEFVENKFSNTINENPSSAEMELYSVICQRLLAGTETKKTVGKTIDHKKKMTHQNKVIPGRIKLKYKRTMERKRTATTMNYLKKNTFACGPWNNKREGNA
jgi:hypothetical protein